MKHQPTNGGCAGVLLMLAAQAGAVAHLAWPLSTLWRATIFFTFALGAGLLAAAVRKGKTP